MKKVILLLGLFLVVISCQEDGELSKDPVVETPTEVPPTTGAKYSGNFVSSPGESVTGVAKVNLDNVHQLILENVMTAGPDLKVYLSKTDSPADFVNLGAFTKAKTTYAIPDNIDVAVYSYVIIYCQQYSVKFGVAKLTKS